MKTLYTIRRCRKNGILYGPSHGADDTYNTVCGVPITAGNWWVTSNVFDGEITCSKCLAVLKKFPTVPQRMKM